MRRTILSNLAVLVALLSSCTVKTVTVPDMVMLQAGTFMMGTDGAVGEDADQAPAHKVTIGRPFAMSATEITNALYEEFDPSHRREVGFSEGDDDAVVNVSYLDAQAYCKWLSQRTGRSFRLPTEAEWEYACRAGSTTAFNTGDTLPSGMHKVPETHRGLVPVRLTVAQSAPNAWGLYDMHGNVEEWCLDWYGPYSHMPQTDPTGPSEGQFRVTRGGSHNTPVRYLRSAHRMAAIPADAHNQIGFRIVEKLAHAGQGQCCHEPLCQEPLWLEPIPFVVPPATPDTPFYRHNHQPAVTWCDNGDLLAIWFSCDAESGREMVVLSSRLRAGCDEWDPATLFFKVPGRNMTGSSLLHLPDGTLLHMNGVANAGDWQNLALCARRSCDNGQTWSAPVLVERSHSVGHQVIAGPIVLSDGTIVQLCDAGAEGDCGTAFHRSMDGGKSWECLWDGKSACEVDWTGRGGIIAGIHAGIVELKDGRLMCFGRANDIDGHMPCSISCDGGHTWEYSPSVFPPVGSGQRLALLRLREGPIMLASFGPDGLFVSLSSDEGVSWSEPRLMTDGGVRQLEGGAHTGAFTMSAHSAEPKGYLACTQAPDGVIHLLSSRLHYRFNLAWIKH